MMKRAKLLLLFTGLLLAITTYYSFFNGYGIWWEPPEWVNSPIDPDESWVLTDVTIRTCNWLNPFSSCRGRRGSKWYRSRKNLYLRSHLFSRGYLLHKWKDWGKVMLNEEVVTDIRIGRPSPDELTSGPSKWTRRKADLWVQKTSRRYVTLPTVVSRIDVLFGADAVDPRPEWTMLEQPLNLNTRPEYEVHVTFERGRHVENSRHKLWKMPVVNANGMFKIMQISDLHFSTGVGKCLDPVPPRLEGKECQADPRSIDFINRLLDDEKPDLVVFSGDQVDGGNSPDSQTAIFKFVKPIVDHETPYQIVFGNHDDEGNLDRYQIIRTLYPLPYSLAGFGMPQIDGVGNELYAIKREDGSIGFLIYFLDSGSYSHDPIRYPGYDWIKASQIDWFRRWSKLFSGYASANNISLAFIHIPLPEYHDAREIVGSNPEEVSSPRYNSHFKDALVEAGVPVLSCGHDHANDYCSLQRNSSTRSPELWLCYNGGSGLGGYGGFGGYVRRMRFFEVDTNLRSIRTWKKLEAGNIEDRVDEQIIVMDGKVIAAS